MPSHSVTVKHPCWGASARETILADKYIGAVIISPEYIKENAMTITPKRGDMYVADLGNGLGSEQSGERPVVIVQNNKGNAYADTTIIVPITSKRKNKLPNHVIIHYGILTRYEGCVLTEQIRTISVYRLRKYIGRLNNKDIRKIDREIKISLDLNSKE